MSCDNLIDEILGRPPRDDIACHGIDGSWSYGELQSLVAQCGSAMERAGVGPGRRVLLMAENHIESMVALFGILRAGGCVVAGRPSWTARELGEVIEIARPEFAFVDQRLLGLAGGRLASFRNVWIAGDDHGQRRFRCPELLGEITPGRPTSAEHDAIILFTSGSVGNPKGVIHTHRSLTARKHLRYELADGCAVLATRSLLCYVMGFATCWEALVRGAAFLLAPSDLPLSSFIQLLARFQVDLLTASPKMYTAIAADDQPVPPGVRCIAGGEPLPARLRDALTRKGTVVHNSFGTTETFNLFSDRAGLDGRMGQPAPWAEVRVMGEHGIVERPHAPGRLVVRTPLRARAYLTADGEQPLSTDDWYDTGDIVTFDDDGDYWFVARELPWLKRDGIKVSAQEIEEIVCAVAGVAEARVIAIADPEHPDQTAEHRIVCFVVVADSAQAAGVIARVQEHVAGNLAEYKQPDCYAPLASLPRLDSGKVDHHALVTLGQRVLLRG